jgi:hypothetical protein
MFQSVKCLHNLGLCVMFTLLVYKSKDKIVFLSPLPTHLSGYGVGTVCGRCQRIFCPPEYFAPGGKIFGEYVVPPRIFCPPPLPNYVKINFSTMIA